ncbi:MAG: hypothetical protein ABSG31_10140 [Tepidisphaeraceae bacterium]|jgi:membrane associated rhomboid family serine protease
MELGGKTRIVVGVAILLALMVYDLARRGKEATRWREYLFLVLCVGVAVVYGAVNDQITSRISWEYFYYGKYLWPTLGPQTPPDPTALSLAALRIGAEATWWTGLIIGAALLIANNPVPGFTRVTYRQLIGQLPIVLAITIIAAIIGGICGDYFLLNWISPDFRDLADTNLWRPHRFMTVYGIHLGGYVGGGIGALVIFARIRRLRQRMTN